MVYFLFLLGFVLLFLGGKYLVEGAVSFAKDIKMSPLIIGIVLVGFGTSVPELITCIKAVLVGSSEIAIGNIIGSNIANILLVLSTGAMICAIPIEQKGFKRDSSFLIFSSLLLTLFCFIGYLNIYSGLLFLAIISIYMYVCYKSGYEEDEDIPLISKSIFVSLFVAFLGMVAVMIGANLLVESAIKIATKLGVSESLIALSAVAIGTSLPELATIIAASVRKHSSLAFGNVVGSNIFNTLGILGTTSIVKEIKISKEILMFDIWAMNLAVLLMIFLAFNKLNISKRKGALLMTLYIAYMIFITVRG